MSSDLLERLESELNQWRTRFDELKLKAGLAKLELREKQQEALAAFDKAYGRARRELDGLASRGNAELSAARQGLEAGWEQLRKTYRQAKEEGGRR